MTPFLLLTSIAVSLPAADVDTDIIFPARFLLHTQKRGLGRYAFADWRFETDGEPNAGFALNRPHAKGAEILVAGPNFGCGSSREQAVWALEDYGIRCIIAESFGEIFFSNCLRNGVLPIVLPAHDVDTLHSLARAGVVFSASLAAETLWVGSEAYPISLDPARRQALLQGWNDTAVILNTEAAALESFEARQRERQPWLYPTPKQEAVDG